jgi:hypothetical protein
MTGLVTLREPIVTDAARPEPPKEPAGIELGWTPEQARHLEFLRRRIEAGELADDQVAEPDEDES